MKLVRQHRKALAPVAGLIGSPKPFAWTGNKRLDRIKGRRFALLASLLRDDDFGAFCSAIGLVEVHWAMLEQQLDRWVQITFIRLGGDELEARAPRGFERKVRYLRRAFERLAPLAPFRERGLRILKDAAADAQERHNLTHAVITHLKPVDGRYTLNALKLDKDARSTVSEYVFDARKFPDLIARLSRLGTDAIHMSLDMFAEFEGATEKP